MTKGLSFDAEAMTSVVTSLCIKLGLTDDQEILHLSNNAVILLRTNRLVVRILRSHTLTDRPYKVAQLGRWFNKIEAPTITLWGEVDQPLKINGHLVTIWDYHPPHGPPPDARDLATTLKQLHRLSPPAGIAPQWDPISPARQRIADTDKLTTADQQYLTRWCDRLEPRVAKVINQSSSALIHGDAHVGNLLRAKEGTALLCDFDSTSIGPFQVDLAATAAAAKWFHVSNTQPSIADAYGYDVTNDPHWDIFRETRELAFVLGGVPHLDNPAVRAEFKRRLTAVKDDNAETPWTPYSHLCRV